MEPHCVTQCFVNHHIYILSTVFLSIQKLLMFDVTKLYVNHNILLVQGFLFLFIYLFICWFYKPTFTWFLLGYFYNSIKFTVTGCYWAIRVTLF